MMLCGGCTEIPTFEGALSMKGPELWALLAGNPPI